MTRPPAGSGAAGGTSPAEEEATPSVPRRFWVRVPGSTSNLGPGFDALGMAVDVFLEATWEDGGARLQVTRTGTLEEADWTPDADLVVETLHEARNAIAFSDNTMGDPAPLTGRLHLHSEIPIGKGLGSSAAARIAGAALGRLLLHGAADREEVLGDAASREGHPDNAAPAVLGGLVATALTEGGEVVAVPLPVSLRTGWVFAAPGVALPTEQARKVLPETVPATTAVRNTARLALLIPALAAGDGPLLARAMADELHVPHRLPLIPGASDAIEAGRDAGAWAVTLSGAGSGLIAVVPRGSEAAVGEAMAAAFAAEPSAEGGSWRALRPWAAGARWGPGPLRPPGPERFATSPG